MKNAFWLVLPQEARTTDMGHDTDTPGYIESFVMPFQVLWKIQILQIYFSIQVKSFVMPFLLSKIHIVRTARWMTSADVG